MNTKPHSFLSVVAALLALSVLATSAETDLTQIMQGLRDDVVVITDGLLNDNLVSVAEGAVRIANHASIPPAQIQLVAADLGAEMPAFKQFDIVVHDLSLSIANAAENGDRDQVIADFQEMLTGCLACHAAYKDRVGVVLGEASTDK